MIFCLTSQFGAGTAAFAKEPVDVISQVSHGISSASATHRSRGGARVSTPPLTSQASTPQEGVTLKATSQYRDPKQAISFVEAFDAKLGISAEMAKEKRELMAESSHAFFRGMPALFYQDLQTTFLEKSRLLPEPAPTVGIVGDAHILNAGTFRGPDGKTVWGLNDFDQSELGSPEWDLERMGVSLYVAGRSGGLSAEESLGLVREMGKSYLDSLDDGGPAYLTRSETDGKVQELIDKAGSKDQEKFLDKWTTEDRTALLRGEDLEEPEAKRGAQIRKALVETFPELKVLDMASKPHSGGSTRGLERYYTLIEQPDGDPWILEVKAVLPTPVQIPDGDLSRGDGEKILGFQKQMGSPVDHRHRAFKLGDMAFFTREREREKDSLKDKAKNLPDVAPLLGQVLARAHASSGADIAGWVDGREPTLLDNLESFSQLYSRQVESDFREFSAKYGGGSGGGSEPPQEKKSSAVDGFLLR